MSDDLRRRDDEERGFQRAMLQSILKGQETLRQDVERWCEDIRKDVENRHEETTKRLDHHSERLRIVEQARAWAMGVAAAIGAGAGWITSHLGGPSK